ncbi:MFS transporter, partial [Anaerospora hongkongensis]|uniref:MFS transporter n=1 Tax=Anaerospora hongkongensis TaxID=244830 RepID=UPI002FD9E508
IYTYTPELYPTRVRALGSGWAAGVGRIGGVLAPAVVGCMIGGADGFSRIFTMFTITLVIIALAVLVLGEETKNKTLDEISR